ncbi:MULTISPECIES: Dyp-type peroxidase [unclassified Leucobacter]|uniref:Dyp-type peroxidase n=1 Tax=unclassified Leucobacter TaxID=2621730 RepID=UPI0030175674
MPGTEPAPRTASTQPDATGSTVSSGDPGSSDPGSAAVGRAAARPTAGPPSGPQIGRRALLTSGALGAGLGAVLGVGGTLGVGAARSAADPPPPGAAAAAETEPSLGPGGDLPGFGGETLPCHGAHQAGVTTVPAAHVHYAAYRLLPSTDAAALRRMFRVLTGDIEGLTSGEAPLADPEPELAARPARLTVTVGVGPALVDRAGAARPPWLGPLPSFERDRLSGDFDGGDLLLAIEADDPLPISHAARMLDRDLTSFAEPLWRQRGFRRARGSEGDGTTMRNLMGQLDGTVNPAPADPGFSGLVWLGRDAGWLAGGSAFVLRRIRMELDTWDRVDRPGREQAVGRRLFDGAPLSAPEGAGEHTPADFAAKDERGLSVIPVASHIRRAHSADPSERIVRRAANYDDGHEAGLLFGCFQRDPLTQFVPIQRRLDEADLLNEWVTHVGSAVFAVLPGFRAGQTLGASLFA